MTGPERLSIVHDAAWRAVVGRVDAAVTAGKISAAQRDLLVRPVQLLQFMADDTPAALGDDFLAEERLRALLYLSAPWAALVDETQRILGEFDQKKMPPLNYAAGVLHHGALVLVGVAAVRVATAEPLVKLFARTVQGLALLSAAAESLGRLEPRGPTGDTLAAMVKELVERDGAQAGDSSVLRPVQSDPVERGRWVALQELMKRVVDLAGDKLGVWDGGFSMVSEVTPNIAVAGETIKLSLSAPIAEAGLEIPETLHVVFVAPGARPIEPIAKPRFEHGKLVVQVPDQAGAGWIGFSDEKRVARSHEFRLKLRDELKKFGVLARLEDAPIPVELIDPYGLPPLPGGVTLPFLAAPPRTSGNRFYTPTMVAAELLPASVGAGEPLTLRWESEAATAVEKQPGGERLAPSGTISFAAPPQDGQVRVTLTPILHRAGVELRGKPVAVTATSGARAVIGAVVVRQDGHLAPYFFGSPLEVVVLLAPETARAEGKLLLEGASIPSSPADPPGKVTFNIPADHLRDVTRFTIVLAGDGPTVDRRRDMKVPIERGKPTMVAAGLLPASVTAGDTLTLRWKSESATEVEKQPGGERLAPSGITSFSAPPQDGQVRITLTPILHRGDVELRGGPVELTATVGARAAIAEVIVRQNGHLAPYFFGSPLEVEALLSPEGARAEGKLLIDGVTIASSPADPPGQVTFSIPANQLRDVTRFTVVLAGGEPAGGRRRDLKVSIVHGQEVTLVAFLPAVLDDEGTGEPVEEPVSQDELDQALGPARASGFDVQVVQVPFVEDALAVLPRPLASSDDPQLPALLEALSVAAMHSRGFEDALWAVVVRRPFGATPATGLAIGRLASFIPAGAAVPRTWASLPAEGAQAVAVSSLGGLSDLVASTFPFVQSSASQARDRVIGDRLRLVGHLLPDERVVMETPRQEPRGCGTGSPAGTGLTAVALDGKGRELSRTPLRAVSASRPTMLAELLPVTPEMRRVELRREDGTEVYAFVRLPGRPQLTGVTLRDGELKWTYQHPDGAVPGLTVELVRRFVDEEKISKEVSVPFVTLDACGNSAKLPLNRVRSADAVRVVASDGWNAVAVDVGDSQITHERALVLRRLGSGGFWADTAGVAVEAWSVNGVDQVDDHDNTLHTPIVHLRPDLHGIIALKAGAESDRRGLGDDDA